MWGLYSLWEVAFLFLWEAQWQGFLSMIFCSALFDVRQEGSAGHFLEPCSLFRGRSCCRAGPIRKWGCFGKGCKVSSLLVVPSPPFWEFGLVRSDGLSSGTTPSRKPALEMQTRSSLVPCVWTHLSHHLPYYKDIFFQLSESYSLLYPHSQHSAGTQYLRQKRSGQANTLLPSRLGITSML